MALSLVIMAAFSSKPPAGAVNSADDAARFLKSLGWETAEEPSAIRRVVIPTEFGAVYESYNELQIKQGYDLRKYRGKTAAQFVFKILNHPGGEVFANLLVFNGEVIGGDLCTYGIGGSIFMLNGG